MGNRCYLTFRIHGTIQTVEDFDRIVAAIDAEEATPNGFLYADAGEISAFLVSSANFDEAPAFHIENCNYARIDDLESVLQAVGIPYHVSHDEGDEYPGGCWTWTPETGKIDAVCTGDGEAAITLSDIRRAMATEKPLQALQDLIDGATAANGEGLPPFAISEAVREHFENEYA